MPEDRTAVVAAGMVAAIRHVFLPLLARGRAAAAFLDHGGKRGEASLMGVPRLFVDEVFRERVARDYSSWLDEFPNYPERLQSEAVAPLQNKLGQLLSVPALRNVLDQVTSTTWATCESLAQQLEELLRTRGLTEAQCEEIMAYVKEAVLQSYRNGVKGRAEHAPQTATPAPQRRPARRTR